MPHAPPLPSPLALRKLAVVLLLWSSLLGHGCTSTESGNAKTVLVTDDLGRQVAVPTIVERVVTLAPSVTELVFIAGAGSRVAGVTTADNYPPATQELPRFSALPIDFEAVLQLKADLVLASDQVNSPQDASTLAAVGPPVFFVGVRTLDDVMRGVLTAGRLLGTATRAAIAADSLAASIRALRALTDTVHQRPRTLVLVSPGTLYSFGQGSYMHSLIALAGGASVTEDHSSSAPVLSDEFVLSHLPEVIFVGAAAADDILREAILEHHPTFDVVPATVAHRVYGIDGDLLFRPGPRLVEGAWQLAARLHPDLVASR